jgi:hypothetical protein
LNEHSGDTVEREDESNTARVESKSTSKLQRRLEIRIHGVVHEDGYELIESNVVKSKESIDDQIDDGLVVEYFAEAGWRKRWLRWHCVGCRLFVRTRGRCELWFEKWLSFRIVLTIGTSKCLVSLPDRLLCVILEFQSQLKSVIATVFFRRQRFLHRSAIEGRM